MILKLIQQKGDVLLLTNFEKAIRGYVVFREVLKVVNDNIMILREPQFETSKQAMSFSSYMIGKYSDTKGEIQKILQQKKRTSYKDPALNHVNTGNVFLRII